MKIGKIGKEEIDLDFGRVFWFVFSVVALISVIVAIFALMIGL